MTKYCPGFSTKSGYKVRGYQKWSILLQRYFSCSLNCIIDGKYVIAINPESGNSVGWATNCDSVTSILLAWRGRDGVTIISTSGKGFYYLSYTKTQCNKELTKRIWLDNQVWQQSWRQHGHLPRLQLLLRSSKWPLGHSGPVWTHRQSPQLQRKKEVFKVGIKINRKNLKSGKLSPKTEVLIVSLIESRRKTQTIIK